LVKTEPIIHLGIEMTGNVQFILDEFQEGIPNDSFKCHGCDHPLHETDSANFNTAYSIIFEIDSDHNERQSEAERFDFPSVLYTGDGVEFELVSRIAATTIAGGHFVSFNVYEGDGDVFKYDSVGGKAVHVNRSMLDGKHELTCLVFYVRK
jgi:hypothetical protein